MARGINKVILIGNLGADPEMRYTQSQQPVANLSVATTDGWTDRNTNERRERTEWHRVVCFQRLAEICGEYLHKGSKVYIEGSLQTRSWQGQDGQTRYSTEVVARDMQMLDPRGAGGYDRGAEQAGGSGYGDPDDGRGSSGQGGARGSGGAPDSPPRRPPEADDDFDDDIPF